MYWLQLPALRLPIFVKPRWLQMETSKEKVPGKKVKMMSAEECAAIIVKGIRTRKREIIMTLVEGKISVFLSKWWPSLLDKLAYNHMAKEPDSPFK